jgi:polysaccharide pyruvyl transferase WcaK-like protein
MRVYVHGWYGNANTGDESYKESFHRVWPEHEFYFFSDGDARSDRVWDLFILGGGDVVKESAVRFASKFKCPKIAMSVTVTEASLCQELHAFDAIYVRDDLSLQRLEKYGVSAHVGCHMLMDISLVLRGNAERGKDYLKMMFEGQGREMRGKKILATVNAHLYEPKEATAKSSAFFTTFIAELAEAVDRTDASFIFLPFSTNAPLDDRVTNGMVNAHCKWPGKNLVIYDSLGTQSTLDIIAACDAQLTTRFHGLIFGLGCGTRTIPISFHDKTAGFCNTIEMDYLNYYGLLTDEIVSAIERPKLQYPTDNDQIRDDYRKKVHLLR